LDVIPSSGFPVVGDFWELYVFYQNQSSDGISQLSPLPNATVEVTIIGNQTKVYSIPLDENGQSRFQFLSEYSDISFQAVYGGNRSNIIAFTQRSEHYVSADFVDFLFELSGVISAIAFSALVIVLHYMKEAKKRRISFSLLIGAVFGLSMAQLVISVIAKFYWLTPWGYPESILGFFTWTHFKFMSVAGIILSAVLYSFALLLRLRKPEVEASS
jgi:hypothetical protein